ncbi:cupin domain-containing protein [Phyllobacterium sp. P30BS-XVII]|uniref:cupin domain-containing protein n=1 Tax=Phyllobacterium sp. P30BS-XVII TaxID=2587046 RepID=UPI0015F798E5|nr:cupin domain-containing protein [Phyllobacterium sp. P30BS-XVII]MBA8903055.1 oxalate decarboxylase [Phyllobacterium sp. P30BS-XVII]
MEPIRRRGFISLMGYFGLASVAQAASFGNPDRPPEGKINAHSLSSTSDPGPASPNLASQFPSSQNPPATDINGMPQFWSSFNIMHKRYQDGGWARQITQEDFAISETISSVNMRLSAGGIREMHWHQQAEWAIMLSGKCRITTLDEQGRSSVEDVEEGDLWYFPPGLPHSLQGLGPDGAEFLLIFDNGLSSEFNTLLVTDWIAHTPPEVLAQNFGVPADAFKNIPLDNLWIFQGDIPPSLDEDKKSARVTSGTEKVTYKLSKSPPIPSGRSGVAQVADSRNFPISKNIAAALETIHPGALREMHWHPNADEWALVIKGKARVTVFDTGPKATTNDFNPGDIWYIKKSLGHYIVNTGDDDLVVLTIFKSDRFAEVTLTSWLTHVPSEMVQQTLKLDADVIARFPADRPEFLPK